MLNGLSERGLGSGIRRMPSTGSIGVNETTIDLETGARGSPVHGELLIRVSEALLA